MGENDSFLPTFKACLKLYIDLKLFTPHLFFTIISQTLNEWMGSFKHHVFLFLFFFPSCITSTIIPPRVVLVHP